MALLLGFFGPKPFFSQQLNSSRWPLYCDQSVTSADVRPSVGREHKKRRYASLGEPLKCALILSTILLGISTHNGLADLLIGPTRAAILALLHGHAGQSFYTAK